MRASFFCAGTAARGGGLSAGRFVYGMVCLRDCLRGEQFAWRSVYGTDSLRLRNLFKDEVRAGTGEPDRETGNRGIGESGNRGRKSGRSVVSGRIGRRPVCRPDVSGAGRMAFFAFAEIFTADFLHRAQ